MMLPPIPLFTLEPLEPRRTLSTVADVDPGFGPDGTTMLLADFRPTLNNGDEIEVYVQADMKVLVVGSFDDDAHFFIQRYFNDGTPDPTFHGGIRDAYGADMTSVYAVRARRDGSIFILAEHRLVELDPRGEFVATYGPSNWVVRDWTVDSNGKVLIANDVGGILRYNRDGTSDLSFNDGQAVALREFGNVANIKPTLDGKIVVHSIDMDFDGNEYDDLYRLNADGSLDESFNNGFIGPEPAEYYRSLNLMPDGSILLGGGASWSGDDFIVRKFGPNGTPDSNFGVDGYVRTDLGSHSDILSYAMADADGGVLAVGTYRNWDYVKVRYRADGSLDTDWADGGRMFSHLRRDVYDWSAASDVGGGVISLSLLKSDVDGDWDVPVKGFYLTRYLFNSVEPSSKDEEEIDESVDTGDESDEEGDDEEIGFDDSVWWNDEGDDSEEQSDSGSDDLLDESDEADDQLDWGDDAETWD